MWPFKNPPLASAGILLAGAFAFTGAAADLPAPPSPGTGSAVLRTALEQSDGRLTAAVRTTYLLAVEKAVLAELRAASQSVPEDCLAEVRSDPVLCDAIFAAVAPPDLSILQNYAKLRAELGTPFVKRYRSLVLGAAVAQRAQGAFAGSEMTPPRQLVRPIDPATRTKEDATARLAGAIADYMRANNITASRLYQDPAQVEPLARFLETNGFKAGALARLREAGPLHGLLKQAMVRLSQRPAQREQTPDTATWLRYLASVFEATPTSSPKLKDGTSEPWPRFPLDTAPWPLLMPLSHAYPLDEARYIFEKYQGRYGNDRYHTYGPFRGPVAERPYQLQPSTWHWAAWPDLIVHGGTCTTMAPMAVQTHVCLCEPAFMAGQPGHCNLLGYRRAGGVWYGVVEQAFAGGPDVTFSSWLFNEVGTAPGLSSQNHHAWARSEYALGLALGMNVGLREYTDTRIAVYLFRALSQAEQKTLGTSLLTHAIQTNPFNPAPWYLLAQQTADAQQGAVLVKKVLDAARHAKPDGENEAADHQANISLENFVEVQHPKPVEHALRQYWNTLAENTARFSILNRPVPQDPATARTLYDLLKTVPGITPAQEMPYRICVEGKQAVAAGLYDHVQKHLRQRKGPNHKSDEKAFATELDAFLQTLDPTEKQPFLLSLKHLFPSDGATDPFLQAVDAAEALLSKKK
jgi:hypothetical protein